MVEGKIVIAWRGGCFFAEKVMHIQEAGAIGMVIINNQEGYFTMSGNKTGPDLATIPSMLITYSVELRISIIDLVRKGSRFFNR